LLRQQAHPALFDADPIAGAEAVPEHQDAGDVAAGARVIAGDASASSSANRNPMTRDIVLEARNLSKQVSSPEGPLTIVRDVSFTVTQGESIALVGPSGAGKSTLLALLAGLELPSSGDVVLAGQSALGALDEDGRARLRAQRVGFVFQSFHLLPSLTALENVMLPLELAGREDARAAAKEMLGRVGLGARARHYPRQLSGGEQQRVALARASVGHPSGAVRRRTHRQSGHRTGERIAQLLFELNRGSDTTLVLVTHEAALAARCARVLSMDAGALLRDVAAAAAHRHA
jgi:putative ABC transport system ATP-binding protein